MMLRQAKVILLVEDNPDDEQLTLMGFRENNILNEIQVMRDGEAAIQFIDHCVTMRGSQGLIDDPLPALIVLDLKLPKVDGIEVLRHIRHNRQTRFIPVVILTSSREEKDLIESYQLGVNAYVQKPIDFIEFTEAVKYLGMFWLLLNESPVYSAREIAGAQHTTL